MRTLLMLPVALAACSAAPSASPTTAEPSLTGSWTIAAIDGRRPGPTAYDRPPALIFTASSYGGNAGCNDFGGPGLQHEGRWYGGGAVSNAMGCAEPLAGQDRLVHGLLASGPRLIWSGPDRVQLLTGARKVDLVRAGPVTGERTDAPTAPATGALWTIAALDGAILPRANGIGSFARLHLEGEGYRLDTPCRTIEGRWRPGASPGELTLEPGVTTVPVACAAANRKPSEALVAALTGTRRYVTGWNGELVMAGGGHWVSGEAVRRGTQDSMLIQGSWEVEPEPGVLQGRGHRRPGLSVSGRSFSQFDGCNYTEGLAILFERTLFRMGSGVSTLAVCPRAMIDPRLAVIAGSNAQVASLPGGRLLLRSEAGEVRLVRTGPARADATVSSRLAANMRFQVMDGGAGGTLTLLPGNRFRLTQPCGVTEGRWRSAPGEVDGAYRFGPDRIAGPCVTSAEARTLQQAFVGNLEVAIGPNRDMALFVGRFGALRARMAR